MQISIYFFRNRILENQIPHPHFRCVNFLKFNILESASARADPQFRDNLNISVTK